MTQSILIGVPFTMAEDETYALPARLCSYTVQGAGDVEVSINGTDWIAVTLDANDGFTTAACFVHSINDDLEIVARA